MKAKYLLGVLAVFAFFTQPALAEFSPGKEGGIVSAPGGAKTLLEPIKQAAPGKAVFAVKDLNAVFLNSVPSTVKAHFSDTDASGKGKAYIVDVASNPALAKLQLCWRGVGSDWGTLACGPISKGRAEVTIDVGKARNATFALVPVLMDGKKQIAWAAHPENTRVQLRCPRMPHTDTASVFTVDAAGTIAIANEAAVTAYEKHYGSFCQR